MDISKLLLDFRITSHCPLKCDLCFRNPGIENQPLSEILPVISKMSKIGFKRIGFTGGEPTMRDDYIDMIRYAKESNFLTYLSTVGHQFINDLSKLEGSLDWVGLPIDGISAETNSTIRSTAMEQQHEVIQSIFNALSQKSTSIKIKLTTVVSRANINELNNVIEFVTKLPYSFDAWRFYQFCPLGVGKGKRELLEIPTEMFNEKMKSLCEKYQQHPISYATFDDRDKANVVMEPNFDIIIPDGENYTRLGNMKSDSIDTVFAAIDSRKDILEKCEANRHWVASSIIFSSLL